MLTLTYHGHSCFEICNQKHRIIIDPFLTGNPVATKKEDEIKVDFILITHGHGDHVGDAISIAKRNDATIIAPHEIAVYMEWQGLKAHGMGTGGGYTFDFGHVEMTPALHGSGLEQPDQKEITYMGVAAGFLLTIDKQIIYHAGDTALFSDMKLLARKPIDVALLPIGDNYTMGPEDALLAAEWLQAKQVIPMHYNTFPVIEQDPYPFVSRLKGKGKVLEVGGTIELYT
ncbi:metal-dependent hydrolase [Hazenella sp. IB182357]|uniref:UPF0173 metal-dependent hydrolase IC620_12125 n=1 Tax=Polycladospora coralii TaxID=2771432 RepID=A0A926NA78_9BACL|nr:metal-dependent hydrolase [Polycladospora coralii]MBD1373101.1 metal-dependent hydrolase [Polycladospora coralii]MBS7529554.1 metal-dependent hydrolase [Polycladospora coralii]